VTLNTSIQGLYIMHALLLLCINQQTKYEVPSFTNSKDITGAKFITGDVTMTTPIRGSLSSQGQHLTHSTSVQNLATFHFSHSRDMTAGV